MKSVGLKILKVNQLVEELDMPNNKECYVVVRVPRMDGSFIYLGVARVDYYPSEKSIGLPKVFLTTNYLIY